VNSNDTVPTAQNPALENEAAAHGRDLKGRRQESGRRRTGLAGRLRERMHGRTAARRGAISRHSEPALTISYSALKPRGPRD
jgi:hypothetical protein